MQSSSAALVIALSAAEGGLISLQAAAATVIGANLGTTTTALLAVWGATANAKRVAISHVVFNLVTALVAALLLVPMLVTVDFLTHSFKLPQAPATTLAVFHTSFNLLGVILMWPLAAPITRWLGRRFRSHEEQQLKPRYLDNNVLAMPMLAAQALLNEITRLYEIAANSIQTAILAEDGSRDIIQRNTTVAESLAAVVVRLADAQHVHVGADHGV